MTTSNEPTNQVLTAPTFEQDFLAEPSPSSSSLLNVGFGAVLSREIDGVLWVKADDHTYAVDKVHLAWQQRINELEKIIATTTVEREIDALAIDFECELCAMIANELPAQFAWNGDPIGDPTQKFKAGFDTACEEIATRIRLRHDEKIMQKVLEN